MDSPAAIYLHYIGGDSHRYFCEFCRLPIALKRKLASSKCIANFPHLFNPAQCWEFCRRHHLLLPEQTPGCVPHEFLQSDPHGISKTLLMKTISRMFAYPFEKRLTENLKLFKLKFMALPAKPLHFIGR